MLVLLIVHIVLLIANIIDIQAFAILAVVTIAISAYNEYKVQRAKAIVKNSIEKLVESLKNIGENDDA